MIEWTKRNRRKIQGTSERLMTEKCQKLELGEMRGSRWSDLELSNVRERSNNNNKKKIGFIDL